MTRFFSSRAEAKTKAAVRKYEEAFESWRVAFDAITRESVAALADHKEKVRKLEESFEQRVKRWEARRRTYFDRRAEANAAVDTRRGSYLSKDREAILDYCRSILSDADYPECIPKVFDLEFFVDTGLLALNYTLPPPESIPRLVEVKWAKASDSFTQKVLSETQVAKLYDDVLYQLTLRSLNDLFRSDAAGALTSIVFNGVVTSVNRATGNSVTACVLSVHAERDAFLQINLPKVDPKACFRQLKGVGSSKLHSTTPIAPILELNRSDSRFVPPLAIAHKLDEGYNLAVMDWEEFEHLIREIFESELRESGGDVKVTQASRDGGVDAVAFDPDPIRGGKIVIQAKRYTLTVPVSAVRDLYGTVLNEGAIKGVLVTTSDYGPDSYEFANGKPLTLINGSNLLHLLGKHGVKAHIDVKAARAGSAQSNLERA